MLVRMLGRIWRLQFVPRRMLTRNGRDRDGECSPPTDKDKAIYIWRGSRGKVLLEHLVHEMLHAADWSKDEEWVAPVAKEIARVLWALGYRPNPETEGKTNGGQASKRG